MVHEELNVHVHSVRAPGMPWGIGFMSSSRAQNPGQPGCSQTAKFVLGECRASYAWALNQPIRSYCSNTLVARIAGWMGGGGVRDRMLIRKTRGVVGSGGGRDNQSTLERTILGGSRL